MSFRGIPSRKPHVCRGGGAGRWRGLAESPSGMFKMQSWCRVHSLCYRPPEAAQERGPCTINYLMSAPSFLCGLLQMGPDLGPALLCVDPFSGMAFLFWLSEDSSTCPHRGN